MAKLIASAAFGASLPLDLGGLTATEEVFDAITSIAPLHGKHEAVSSALQAQIGLTLPAIGRMVQTEGASVAWAGHGQYFVFGAKLPLMADAAQTDQTDAWASMVLKGRMAREVLARLTAIDLRPSAFGINHVARAQLGHMNALIVRGAEDRYRLMVFRSMAQTLAHEIERAMQSIVARDDQNG